MVEQFRMGPYAYNEYAWMTEIITGRVDDNEDIETAAHREVYEESGCNVYKLVPIAKYFPSAGGCNEKMFLFCGLFNSDGAEGKLCGVGSEMEDICTHLFSLETLFANLKAGEINNSASLIAIQWLKINHAHI